VIGNKRHAGWWHSRGGRQSTGFGLDRQTPRNSLLRIYFISARLTSFRTSR